MFRIDNYLEPLAIGTTSNVIATFATLPLARAYILLQLPGNKLNYSQTLSSIFTRDGIRTVYSATGNMMRMSPLQSMTFFGVSNVVYAVFENYSPFYSPFTKGIAAGFLSAQAESLVVAWQLPKIIAAWEGSSRRKAHTSNFWRCYRASNLKNTVANSLTLTGQLIANEQLQKNTNLPPSVSSGLAGTIGAAGAGLLFAPFVYLETRTHQNSDKTLTQHFKEVDALGKFWRGAGARIVQKSIQFGFSFFIRDQLEAAMKKFKDEIPSHPSTMKKP